MCKSSTGFFFIILFFFSTLSYAARPHPVFQDATLCNIQHQVVVEPKQVRTEERCKGSQDEECLERKTLAANLDYIYTQNHNP
ncbi:PREDICTED: phytosulfokines-like [Nicotiana attenuata]|uniref:phytosulfokines-like n=1 Tax=Nicotiana attenuata TaxID=49451 RepID=UPI000904FBD9|nr:PREDICTED: phytosulfokines-like [Nicotiana attenuata]